MPGTRKSKPIAERLLTAEEVGAHLGYSVRTIYDKVQRKEIPHIRLGRTLRFRLSDVNAWVEKSTPTAVAS